ncbi:hypothetical protein ACH4VX_21095 [Streptomyces sp. NPDC020731]|uniref:hypothetical protein n=1 Tax=Streptomyces sp. NPDC020731 TaxID=3365085 RepID=UPI00378E5F70
MAAVQQRLPVASPSTREDIAAGEYGVHVKGWVPDHPDAENFTGPFFGEGNVPDNDYDGGTVTESLLPRAAARSDRSATDGEFGRIQDVPVLGPAGQAVRGRPGRRVRPGVPPRRLDRLPVLGAEQEPAPYRCDGGALPVGEGAPVASWLSGYCAPGRTSPLS